MGCVSGLVRHWAIRRAGSVSVGGCHFDGHFYELEDTWHPDLGPPFGIMYCVRCDCLALPKKGQITGKVRCRNFKHECPKTDCAEPVLLPNQCCKVCPPRGTSNKVAVVPAHHGDDRTLQDSPKSSEYLAVISSPTSRHVARAILNFEPPGLHYSLQFSADFRPTSVIFQDEDGNALYTQTVDGEHLQNQKFCGVWDRIPRMYRRTLGKEALQISITTREDTKGGYKGTIILKKNQLDETFSALMTAKDSRRNGLAGAATISPGLDGNSIDFSIFLQGMPVVRKDVKQVATIVLEKVDDRSVIRETTSAVSPKNFEVTGRMADLTNQEMKWLARGRLTLTLRFSNGADFDLSGPIATKATCSIFQAVLYDVSRPKPYSGSGSGVAIFQLQPDGGISYKLQLKNFVGRPTHMTIETNPRKGRRRVVDDIAGAYASGWANGTYSKQQSRDLQNLVSDDLVISIANEHSAGRMQGQIKQIFYEEVQDHAFPNILSENPNASFLRDVSGTAVAWMRLDENCMLNYHVFVDGYADAYVKKLQGTLVYSYDQHGTPVRKQVQLEVFKKYKSVGRVKNLKNDVLMGMPNGTVEVWITATGEVEPRLRGTVNIVDECSPKHRIGGMETIIEDQPSLNALVPIYTCQYADKTYEDGGSWKSEHKECTMCSCQRGRIVCEEMICPKVNCRNPVKLDGECCPTCQPAVIPAAQPKVADTAVNTSIGCFLDKKWHKPGATWHPYIPPFGFSRCAICTCTPGLNTVNCTRLSCPALTCSDAEAFREAPSDCCRKCPAEPFTAASVRRGLNDTMGDEGAAKTPEDILREGGCKFQTETLKNGAEWHPRVQPFGVMNCVSCRCKDGKSTCKRQKCPKLSCPLIRKDNEECCPRCTDSSDPKARPNRSISFTIFMPFSSLSSLGYPQGPSAARRGSQATSNARMRRYSPLMLVLGTICLLIPGMNVVATAGNTEASKLINGSCLEASVCRGALPTLDPEILDFGPVIIGQTIVRDVRIRSYNRSFDVSRVAQPESGVLFVQLKPKTVRSDLFVFRVRVALVPRLMGAFGGVITVFTSLGRMRIPVQAQVAPSPFRISPIEHPRLPMGSTFEREIVVYNPFGSALQIVQVYLSGGPFHLTVPENADKPVSQHLVPTDKDKWDIPPFKSRAVAHIIMDTSRAFVERSYLRLKLNSTVFEDIIVPIDVSVFEGCGLYSVDGVLDFGFVELNTEPVVVPLRLRLSKPCLTRHIEKISDVSATPIVSCTIVQRSVSDSGGPTTVATLVFPSNNSAITGLIQGEIAVLNGLERLLVPYRGYVSSGRVSVSAETAAWHMSPFASNASLGVIRIRNDYPVPVVILEASITGNRICSESEIVESSFPITIPASSTAAVVAVRNRIKTRVPHNVTIALATNVGLGRTEVPVQMYTGELRVDVSGINHWMYHGMSFGCNETGLILIRNTNPTKVILEDVIIESDCFGMYRITLCRADLSCEAATGEQPTYDMDSGSFLKVYVTATRLNREGVCKSTVRVRTNFQVLLLHLKILVLPGRLELYEHPVIFEDMFPSRFVQRNLTVFNTFDKQIEIFNIFSEEFTRLRMHPPLDGVEVSSQMGLVFDTLTFDARELCKELPGLCYVGFDLETSTERSEAWKRPFRMVTHSSVEIDRRMKERQLALWNQLSEGNSSFQINTTLTVKTKQAYTFHLPVSLNFVWPPPLVTSDHDSLDFPLLSVGNFSEIDVEVTNPTDKSLFVHAYVFRDDKAASWNRDIFYVKSIVPKGTTQGFYQVDDDRLPERVRLPTPSHGAAATIVPYEGQFLVRVVFQPQSEACYSAMLHIRNNLTVVESIPIRGCGVEPQVRFANDGTVPATPALTMKLTAKDGAYCRNRTVDTVERSKIRRTGRIALTNTVGAYIAVESVRVVEDDWYHRSFALTKPAGPFLIAPNKTRRLHVEFNPDFGMARKTGTVLVFVSDRADPFAYRITGEVDPVAMRLCGPHFGRSEKDVWIRALLLWHRWAWMLYLLPGMLWAGYIALFREWYTKRLKLQLRAQLEQIEQRAEKASARMPDQESRRSRGARRRGNCRPEDGKEQPPPPLEEELLQADPLHTLSWSSHGTAAMEQQRPLPIEKQIPEPLRELYSVAHFAVEPWTFLWHFRRLPTRKRYRLFLLAEILALPVRLVMSLVRSLVGGVLCVCGWRRCCTAAETEEEELVGCGYPIPVGVSKGGLSAGNGLAVSGSCGWTGKLRAVFRDYAAGSVSRSPEVTSPEVPVQTGRGPVTPTRNGILSKDSKASPSHHPPVATVAPVKRLSLSNKGSTVGPQQPPPPAPSSSASTTIVAPIPKSSPISEASRDSSYGESGESEEGHDAGRLSPEDETSRSARKLRRKQMHQAKLMKEKAEKLAKTYNKTQRKAEEKRAVEVKTESVLAGSVEPSSDSDATADRVQRIEAARRRAKLEAEKQLKKQLAAPKPPPVPEQQQRPNGHNGYRSPEIFVPVFVRPATYPVQTDVIQQAFFKVEPKENGLMFTEMTRDECFQLVKQLKRDHPNLFQLDPKAAVELLQAITRSGRYRVNGEYVDLAQKSSVQSYAVSNRLRKDGAPLPSAGPSTRPPQRPGDPRSPESGWSFSPTGSDSGVTTDSRLSPMLSYADVAGQPSLLAARRSVDIVQQQQRSSESTEPWKTSYSPAAPTSATTHPKTSTEPSRFPWDESVTTATLTGSYADAALGGGSQDLDDAGMLNAYQRRQRDLVDEASTKFVKDRRSLFFSSQSHELESYLADLESKNRESEQSATTAWPDSFMAAPITSQNVWDDAGWNSFPKGGGLDEPPWAATGSGSNAGSGLLPSLSSSQLTPWPKSIWSTSTFFNGADSAAGSTAPAAAMDARQAAHVGAPFGAIGEVVGTSKRGVDKF
ncbi:Chordin [Hypsibius exemplaris]|uniref:Chordin n=1 Tax=Hypsibius exemplaris TaxID=2072580 RepID=A0A1W0WFU0_HYPEX|nr:Chordin [Hypsibius exemplaris]